VLRAAYGTQQYAVLTSVYTECPKSRCALEAAAAQYNNGAVKKRVQTCLQARGGHFQHLLREEPQRGTWYFTAQ
jgi:hypothetical protein